MAIVVAYGGERVKGSRNEKKTAISMYPKQGLHYFLWRISSTLVAKELNLGKATVKKE